MHSSSYGLLLRRDEPFKVGRGKLVKAVVLKDPLPEVKAGILSFSSGRAGRALCSLQILTSSRGGCLCTTQMDRAGATRH